MNKEEVKQRMQKTLDFLQDELAQVKTGRASPSMIEKIMIDVYETKMLLVELATITAPEPGELLVAPFDQTIIKNIERAIILHKDLGLSPIVDDEVIRIKIAPLNEERRKELVKVLGQKLEAGRVAVRSIRQEEKSAITRQFEEKEISEDDKFQQIENLQKITDEYNAKIQAMGDAKEKEILGV